MPLYGGRDNNSLTYTSFPCGNAFYAGTIGVATTEGGQPYSDTLRNGATHKYMIWVVEGMNSPSRPSGDTAAQWGDAQGQKAFSVANSGRWQHTYDFIWLDIEKGNYWNSSSSAYSSNVSIINNFIQQFTSNSWNCGIYSGPSLWSSITGDATIGTTVTGVSATWTSEKCLTSKTCPTTMSSAQSFGGTTPTWWQYTEDVCSSTADFDVGTSLPS